MSAYVHTPRNALQLVESLRNRSPMYPSRELELEAADAISAMLRQVQVLIEQRDNAYRERDREIEAGGKSRPEQDRSA